MERPFDVAVREHGPTVLRVCRAVLGPGADADDAWSETFLSALRAWPGLDGDADVRGWLITIAHRRAIDVTRARARRAVPVAQTPDVPTGGGIAEPPDEELWAAVRALPDKQRRCVAYHHLGGLPYLEVATLVGGTAEAARRAAADGIAALRRGLVPARSGQAGSSGAGSGRAGSGGAGSGRAGRGTGGPERGSTGRGDGRENHPCDEIGTRRTR